MVSTRNMPPALPQPIPSMTTLLPTLPSAPSVSTFEEEIVSDMPVSGSSLGQFYEDDENEYFPLEGDVMSDISRNLPTFAEVVAAPLVPPPLPNHCSLTTSEVSTHGILTSAVSTHSIPTSSVVQTPEVPSQIPVSSTWSNSNVVVDPPLLSIPLNANNVVVNTTSENTRFVQQVAGNQLIQLTAASTRTEVLQIIANIQSPFHNYGIADIVPHSFQTHLKMKFKKLYPDSQAQRTLCEYWMSWDKATFCKMLDLAYPDLTTTATGARTFLEKISQLVVEFSIENPALEDDLAVRIDTILSQHPDRTAIQETAAVAILMKRLPQDGQVNWRTRFLGNQHFTEPVLTVDDWRTRLLLFLEKIRTLATELRSYDIQLTYGSHSSVKRKTPTFPAITPSAVTQPKGQKRPVSTVILDPNIICTGCGRPNHMVSSCQFTKSQYYNTTVLPYLSSPIARSLLDRFPGATFIPGKRELALQGRSSSSASSSGPSSSSAVNVPNKKQKGIYPSTILSSLTDNFDHDYLLVNISPLPVSQAENKLSTIQIKALLDSGSLAGDFIAERVISNYKLEPYIVSTTTRKVCSGLDNKCFDISKSIQLVVSIFSEFLNKNQNFEINARILSSSPLDLVIGRPTIRKFSLFTSVPSQVSEHTNMVASLLNPHRVYSSASITPCGCHFTEELQPSLNNPKRYPHLTQGENRTVSQTPRVFASLLSEAEKFLENSTPDEDEIDYDKMDVFTTWSKPLSPNNSVKSQSEILSQIHFGGSLELQSRLRALCEEFADIFCDELPPTPAKIDPFDMVVDVSKWQVPTNRRPPRQQSTSKQVEMTRQISILMEQGIIEKSSSAHYSQVLMVPKPLNGWRMCIDYRTLNECTSDASWPIPNIADMLQRILSQRPTIYGCMDLTQGYHQAPLAAAAKVFTSFITFSGVYQFTRLPFGLKRAPSHFQEQMATTVLHGLIYLICEMYIDDLNTFANTDDTFLDRLRRIFTRLREHHLFLKASKCFLGFPELVYVGKVMTPYGLKMSEDKLRSVLDFPLPVVSKQLKSFLGLVNYFHDFIRNHSSIVKPLHALILDYDKTRKITWNTEAVTAFHLVKHEVSLCPTLHYLDDTSPIFLHTDASDYGIGGYLFQLVDGKEHPIAFHSRSFSKPQLRWSVPQKEGFGIYDSVTKLSVLLQGREFTLRTDHRNLLFIKHNSNPMIVRWYMALSEFSFTLEFISGSDNGIADWMSRLCRNHMIDEPEIYSETDIIFSAIMPKVNLPSDAFKKISAVHHSKVGHFGVERTIKRLLKTGSWEYMRQHVKLFIQRCPCCQKMSMIKTAIAAHPFTTSTYTPMECLNIDFIGPFPDGGSVLVIVDTFTRWVELYPTPDATALSAATSLLSHFGRFGAPHQLRSDNGPHFVNLVIEHFLKLVGVDHCLTLAYSKQENAIVERFNKEINRHIRALTFDNSSLTDYRMSLPFVQRILNSNYSDRLHISAADILFGKVINLDRGLFLPKDERASSTKPLSAHVSKLIQIQDNLLQASAKELLRTDLLHQTHNQIQIHKEFLPDTYVLVHYRTGAPPTRLHTFWRGPMRVMSGKNSRYLLYDLITHKENIYHASDMKQFLFDPSIIDPVDVARRDYMEFFIKKILEHRGDISRKKDLEFLVSWLGYDDSNNSWEPYSHLRDSDQLHAYLIENKMRQLIPAKFQ